MRSIPLQVMRGKFVVVVLMWLEMGWEREADDGVCTVVALSCGPGFIRRRSELRSTTYKHGMGERTIVDTIRLQDGFRPWYG
jgi:hypothetical protein